MAPCARWHNAHMSNWKQLLFARNEFNFRSWLAAGLLIFGCAFVCALVGVTHVFSDGGLDAHLVVLVGILLALLGHFGIALQEYFARWVEKNEPAADKSG